LGSIASSALADCIVSISASADAATVEARNRFMLGSLSLVLFFVVI
jgi:hypothetical protein